jgi:hypothetical protein
VQVIVVEATELDRISALVELADEMMEDPHCRVVLPAAADEGAIVVSLWADDVAPDIEIGLQEAGWRTRRYSLIE